MNIDIEKIKKIAKKAGEKTLEYYNQSYDVSYKKGDKDTPLTEADLASEKIISSGLQQFKVPILSEEAADDLKRLDSAYVFIVDPLDGTSDFIKKTDEFSVMIGLIKNGRPVAGVAYEPVKKRFYVAEKGGGAYVEENGKKNVLKVNDNDDFSKWRILISRSHLRDEEVALSKNLGFRDKIPMGSVPIKIGKIAMGEAELYINSSDRTGEWDTCVGQLIIEEAGGKITDMDGEGLIYNKEIPKNLSGFIVTNGKKHDTIVRVLSEIRK